MNERDELAEALATESDELIGVADLVWEAQHGAPPLENDPVAVMLGLVASSTMSIDKTALKRLRANARLTVSDLAQRLTARGWAVTQQTTFGWELRGASGLSPALIAAIADVLGVDTSSLVKGTPEPKPDWLATLISSDAFAKIVTRWARVKNISAQLAADSLESRTLASVQRGGRPEQEQLLETLNALVDAVERGQGR